MEILSWDEFTIFPSYMKTWHGKHIFLHMIFLIIEVDYLFILVEVIGALSVPFKSMHSWVRKGWNLMS